MDLMKWFNACQVYSASAYLRCSLHSLLSWFCGTLGCVLSVDQVFFWWSRKYVYIIYYYHQIEISTTCHCLSIKQFYTLQIWIYHNKNGSGFAFKFQVRWRVSFLKDNQSIPTMLYQIPGNSILWLTVCSVEYQRKHQRFALLTLCVWRESTDDRWLPLTNGQ